jgi:hypothetical protein
LDSSVNAAANRSARDLGRIVADSDVDALAAMLIGTAHLLFADRQGTPP